ncbi:MAG: nucleotidyltransferase family protein [Thermoplasmatales archaeon]
MKIAGVLLAAGKSERFRGQKLLSEVAGKKLIEWSIKSLQGSGLDALIAVVSPSLRVTIPYDFAVVVNGEPELGISHSISLSLSFVEEMDGVLFHLADQPFVDEGLMKEMVSSFRKDGEKIVAASVNRDPRNPMIFPRKYYQELRSLSGDHGAKSVALHHPDQLATIEVQEEILLDVDTLSDLEDARKFME